MTDVALILALVVLAISSSSAVWMLKRTEVAEETASNADRGRNEAVAARDAAVVRATAAEARIADLARQLVETQGALGQALGESATHVQTEIETSSPSDAAHLLDGVLARPLSGAGQAVATAAGGDRPTAAVVSPSPKT